MSEYMVCKGQFDDLDCLKETLTEFGIDETCMEIHNDPVVLHGYNRTDKNTKAELVIRSGGRRAALGNTYDIGFAKQAGVYVGIMNDMDRHRGLGKAISDGSLLQNYCKNKILREVKKRRCTVTENSITADGKIRIVLSS